MMKILMLLENNPYPQDSRVRKEATTLSGAGYDVTVISPRGTGQPWHECVKGVRVYRFPAAKSGDGLFGYAWEYGWSMLAFGLISLWVLLRHGFDVVHTHNPPDMLVLVALFYKLLGKRFVFDHHDLSPEMYYARFRGQGSHSVHRVLLALEKLSCRAADHVIATNQSYRKVEVERDGVPESHITIVRNAPIIGRDEPAVQPVDIGEAGKLLIGYMGVIGYQDGVDNLLHALCHLRTVRHDFLCVVMGDGDALADVKALAAQLRLGDCVRFLGWIPQQQVASYLQAMDICAAPEPLDDYNDRSTVIKITEYMAAGKPIVAFDLTEHHVTADDAALYAKPNDPCDFACKIVELMDDPQRRTLMGRYGRQRVEETLNWSQQAQNLLSVYVRLASNRRR